MGTMIQLTELEKLNFLKRALKNLWVMYSKKQFELSFEKGHITKEEYNEFIRFCNEEMIKETNSNRVMENEIRYFAILIDAIFNSSELSEILGYDEKFIREIFSKL